MDGPVLPGLSPDLKSIYELDFKWIVVRRCRLAADELDHRAAVERAISSFAVRSASDDWHGHTDGMHWVADFVVRATALWEGGSVRKENCTQKRMAGGPMVPFVR